jgi:hypothetical protein
VFFRALFLYSLAAIHGKDAMTIHITPEPDGSYTVSCGNETIVVGRPRRADTAGGGREPITWPDDPEGNPNGVRAYVAVRPSMSHSSLMRLSVSQRDLAAEWLENADDIVARVENRLLNLPTPDSTGPLEVRVTLMPGRPIDMASITHRLNDVAQDKGVRIVLYIEAGVAQIADTLI